MVLITAVVMVVNDCCGSIGKNYGNGGVKVAGGHTLQTRNDMVRVCRPWQRHFY